MQGQNVRLSVKRGYSKVRDEADAVQQLGVELAGVIPNDALMSEYEFTGRPLITLPGDALVVRAVYEIADTIFSNGQG